MTKDFLGRRVKLPDSPFGIHGDNRIQGGVDHRSRSRFTIAEGLFRSLSLRDVRGDPTHRVHLTGSVTKRTLDREVGVCPSSWGAISSASIPEPLGTAFSS